MRDITLEDTFTFNFTTRALTGIPTVLAGVPVLSVLEGDNATPITTGVTVDVDRASVVGLNQGKVVAAAAQGFQAGKSYSVYISTGTVDGVSAVGEVVHEFTIGLSAAAVDLANATDGLGALKAACATAVGFATPTNITAGIITTVTTVTNKTGYSLSTAGILAIWDQLSAAVVTANTMGKLLVDNVNATISSRNATTPPTATQNADALLNRDMSVVSDTTARSPLNALRFLRNKWSVAGTTLTVTKEDDSSAAWTATVSTDATADPIVGNDPA